MCRASTLLGIAALAATTAAAQNRITVVLDASAHMAAPLDDGQARIEVARQVVGAWIAEQTPATLAGLELLVIGGAGQEVDDADSCQGARPLLEPGATDLDSWRAALEATETGGSRPLIDALITVAGAMASRAEATTPLVMLTSGEDECGGDAEAAAAALAGGIDLTVIGIGLTEAEVERFTAVAATVNAADGESLLEALRSTTQEIIGRWVLLEGPAEITCGRTFEVSWEGPEGEADFLSVAKPDSGDGVYLDLHLAEHGSPAILSAPPNPGTYEVRYVDGRTGKVLHRQPFEATPAKIVIDAPKEVRAGERFQVTWTGPDALGDFITIAPRGSRARRHLDWIYTSVGSPASMAAPFNPGAFEIRYVKGATNEVLAAVALRVRR